jgi:hypothetical protein
LFKKIPIHAVQVKMEKKKIIPVKAIRFGGFGNGLSCEYNALKQTGILAKEREPNI